MLPWPSLGWRWLEGTTRFVVGLGGGNSSDRAADWRSGRVEKERVCKKRTHCDLRSRSTRSPENPGVLDPVIHERHDAYSNMNIGLHGMEYEWKQPWSAWNYKYGNCPKGFWKTENILSMQSVSGYSFKAVPVIYEAGSLTTPMRRSVSDLRKT